MNYYMQKVLDHANNAYYAQEVPVAALICNKQGEIIALTHNLVKTNNDPSAHAEILAIREACQKIGNFRLIDHDLYTNLEPCAMCAQAISFARIRRLYYSCSDEKGGAVENGPNIFSQTTCHHKPEIYSGIGEQQAASLLRKFFRELR